MGWWPFGRKRRKDKTSDKPRLPESRTTVENEKRPTEPQRVLRQPPRAPANPFDDPLEQSEKEVVVPRPTTPQQHSPPQINYLNNASADDLTALPLSPIKKPDPDTPLQPVSASYLNSQQDPTLARAKSTKRRKDDRAREDQVRAMTAPVPIPKRIGADSPRFFDRDSKRRRSDQNRQFQDSKVSLSAAASARSSMTGMSDSHRFDIGPMDMLSPRPTLRHSLHGQYASATALRSTAPSRNDSRKEPRPFSPESIHERDTIDEYADNMNARTLRELMDRDDRRKERKRKAEEARARRRLERHAATGDDDNGERRRRARRKEAELPASRGEGEAGPSGLVKQYAGGSPLDSRALAPLQTAQDPFQDTQSQIEPPAALNDVDPEPVPTIPYSPPASPSPPTSPTLHFRQPSNLSSATDPRSQSTQDVSDTASYDRRASQPAVGKTGAIAALFRRSRLGKRGSVADIGADASPGSFSNTSRESMGRHFTPPPDVPERTYRRRSSGAPMRTKSKFREDLPELSAGDVDDRAPEIGERENEPPQLSEHPYYRSGELPSPPLEVQRSDVASYDSVGLPSATLLSQSLASIDSEGSWLSGRPQKRSSQQMSTTRSSLAQRPSVMGASTDDLNNAAESSMRTRERHSHSLSGLRSQMVPKEEESEETTPGPEDPRSKEQISQGFIVQQPTPRVETPGTDEYETGSETSETHEDHSMVEVSQAFGLHHVRSVSAGSARLLDIPARRDSVRNSQYSASPTSPTNPQASSPTTPNP